MQNCTDYFRQMKYCILLACLSAMCSVNAQPAKDTTFSVRGYNCQCKYALNGKPDIKPFDLHEKPASYPGGEEEWKRFLKKNADKSLKGKDKIELRFKVDADGNLSGFEILNHAPAQKFEEVVRVLKLSGKWFPAVRDGYCVAGDVTITAEF